MRTAQTRRRLREKIPEGIFFLCALATTVTIVLIFLFLFNEAIWTFQEVTIFDFLFGHTWQPVSEVPKFGVLPLLAGSVLTTSGALLISVPLGISCATYLAEVAHPTLKEIFKPMVELLAGIPSVVYGFIALTVLADITHTTFGTVFRLNALNGAIILAVMVTPTIVSISEDAIASVPRDYKEAALALGSTRWEATRRVVVPSALPGIGVGVMLGVGRAIGETMAILMATGNAPLLTLDFLSSVETMTAVIAIEMGEVTFGSVHYHALFAVAVVLFIITFLINAVADYVVRRFGARHP